MEMRCTSAPARSNASRGAVSSASLTPSVARKATFFPASEVCMGVILALGEKWTWDHELCRDAQRGPPTPYFLKTSLTLSRGMASTLAPLPSTVVAVKIEL